MSSIITDSRIAGQKIWVQTERDDPMSLICEPDTEIIDDLKQMVYGEDRDKYKAFHREEYLRPDKLIPTDTSDKEPIQLKLIKNLRSTQSSNNNDNICRVPPLDTDDANGTQIMINNRQMTAKCDQRMNKLQSNYAADIVDNVNSSRDCLILTNTNSSSRWTLNGLLWQGANTLWRRLNNGHSASYKSKSD